MLFLVRIVKGSFLKPLLLVLLACVAQTVTAAQISANLSIDWSTFKITPIDTGQGLPTITWTSKLDFTNLTRSAETYYMGGNQGDGLASDTATNWTTGTSVTKSQPGFSVSATTSPDKLQVNAIIDEVPPAYIFPDGELGDGNVLVHMNAHRMGFFNVNSNGRVRVEADFHTEVNIGAKPGLNIVVISPDGFFQLYPGDSPVSHSGTIAKEFDVYSAGDNYLDLGVGVLIQGINPVPVPSAFWLFGSILVGASARKLRTCNLHL